MRGSCSSAARPWTGHATSGGTSSRRARSASSRPRRTGSSPASTPCRATTKSSSRCRSDGVDHQEPASDREDTSALIPSADLPISRRPQARKLLLHASDLLPRVLLQAAEALAQIEQRILVAAFGRPSSSHVTGPDTGAPSRVCVDYAATEVCSKELRK